MFWCGLPLRQGPLPPNLCMLFKYRKEAPIFMSVMGIEGISGGVFESLIFITTQKFSLASRIKCHSYRRLSEGMVEEGHILSFLWSGA